MSFVSKVHDKITDVADDVAGSVSSKLDDWGDTAERLKASAVECHAIAKETVDLCDDVEAKGNAMVGFGDDIKSTLTEFADGKLDASALQTIHDLVSGNEMKKALEMAEEMDDLAKDCVDKSIRMLDVMEQGMESLPDSVALTLDEAINRGSCRVDAQISNVDKDIEDIVACVAAIKQLNLLTAMKLGVDAIQKLALKMDLAKLLFATIRGFACDVVNITDSFSIRELNVRSVASKAKDMWRCIHLSSLVKQCAEQVGRLVKAIIDLFQETSARVSGLWGSLAFAKDCMADCTQHVIEARRLCVDAKTKSIKFIETSVKIKENFESLRSLDSQSVTSLASLEGGKNIRRAISLATNMDDTVRECADKVVIMIDRVSEGVANLPSVLVEGIPDDAGKAEDDPVPADVQADLDELDKSRAAIENANIVKATYACMHGFSRVPEKGALCKDMLEIIVLFCDQCMETIEQFLGVWSLEAAKDKIIAMCRLVNLGEMIRQFAAQVKALLVSMIALMRAVITKVKHVDVAGAIDDVVRQAAGAMKKFGQWSCCSPLVAVD